jgi:hypothetical protein
MTYQEALDLQSALESALSSGATYASVTNGDRTLEYHSTREMKNALAAVNRDIKAYQRRSSNINPNWTRPRWH